MEPRKVIGDWELVQNIGAGSFAVVWKARHIQTGDVVAIKEISTNKLNKKLKQSLESEVSILKQIQHKNIVQLLEVQEVRWLSSDCLLGCPARPWAASVAWPLHFGAL
jgi:serine/threonine protein kinase